MPGKFEVHMDRPQEYRFTLKAATGEVIALSEVFESREACEKSIEAVRKHAPYAKLVEAGAAVG
ncbi:YegP family protein [Streptacidiphilus anmyonensis]|uniref:YegP family protein n=1 Tax=Streptacidiphilus anmyonensis TaxID=405782 RepID=UPI0005A9AA9D|nr:YegP family protein [Streptacidiphilus anmyonensis]